MTANGNLSLDAKGNKRVLRQVRSIVQVLMALLFVSSMPNPVVAQTLYAAAIELVARSEPLRVSAMVNSNGPCDISDALLTADAERTLRRDGIVTGESTSFPRPVLLLSVTTLPSTPGWCAVSIGILLAVVVDPAQEVIMLAAQSGDLLITPDHVDRTRRQVERNLSVVANAIRRAQDAGSRRR